MIDRLLETASKIKLTGGLVGRTCTVLIVLTVIFGGIAMTSSYPWIQGGALVAILVSVVPLVWRIVRFAESNPHVAILDGAQFLKHQQLVLASKDNPQIRVVPGKQVEAHPRALGSSTPLIEAQEESETITPIETEHDN